MKSERDRAVSTALATIIMIAIMLTVAAVLINSTGNGFGTLFSGSQVHYEQQQTAEEERFGVDTLFFNTATSRILPVLHMFVRNNGAVEVEIVSIYVAAQNIGGDNQSASELFTPSQITLVPSPDQTCILTANNTITLPVGKTCEFDLNL